MKFIFIVGSPRSGTTYLQSRLTHLSGYISAPETHFFSALYSRKFAVQLRAKAQARKNIYLSLGWMPPPQRTVGCLVAAFEQSIEKKAAERGAVGFIEKTPIHLWYIKRISEYFPQAHFVHIIRDRYENVRSLYEACKRSPEFWGGKRSISECNARWCKDIKLHGKSLGASRHHFINYDALKRDPCRIIIKLSKELSISLDDSIKTEVHDIVLENEIWKINNFSMTTSNSLYPDFMNRSDFEHKFKLESDDISAWKKVISMLGDG